MLTPSIELTKFKVNLIQLIIVFFLPVAGFAQTEMDGIMMNKNQFCNGFVYDHGAWDHYWEGSFKRDNQNLGTVTTQSVMLMSNYGITGKLNLMASAPYVWTKASEGTLHGLKGVQDLSVFLKWKAFTRSFGRNRISLVGIAGFSTPLTNYVIDFLPMSIGLGSTNLTARGMIDFTHRRFSVTGSAAYIRRSNVRLDRDSYYDTQIHLTNEVRMPDAAFYQLRTGYRGRYLLAEALLTNWTTLGGFDITKNNMPFPSNKMNATMVGAALKYTIKQFTPVSLVGGASYTLAGRNMGQSTNFNVGAFYVIQFRSKKI